MHPSLLVAICRELFDLSNHVDIKGKDISMKAQRCALMTCTTHTNFEQDIVSSWSFRNLHFLNLPRQDYRRRWNNARILEPTTPSGRCWLQLRRKNLRPDPCHSRIFRWASTNIYDLVHMVELCGHEIVRDSEWNRPLNFKLSVFWFTEGSSQGRRNWQGMQHHATFLMFFDFWSFLKVFIRACLDFISWCHGSCLWGDGLGPSRSVAATAASQRCRGCRLRTVGRDHAEAKAEGKAKWKGTHNGDNLLETAKETTWETNGNMETIHLNHS